jgi:hypothetical protein
MRSPTVSLRTKSGHKHRHHEAIALARPKVQLEGPTATTGGPKRVCGWASCAIERRERTEQLSPGKPATGEMPDLRKCQGE